MYVCQGIYHWSTVQIFELFDWVQQVAAQSTAKLPPQTIRLSARLPQLYRAIFTTSAIKLAIGRKADRPDGAMVSLLDLCA